MEKLSRAEYVARRRACMRYRVNGLCDSGLISVRQRWPLCDKGREPTELIEELLYDPEFLCNAGAWDDLQVLDVEQEEAEKRLKQIETIRANISRFMYPVLEQFVANDLDAKRKALVELAVKRVIPLFWILEELNDVSVVAEVAPRLLETTNKAYLLGMLTQCVESGALSAQDAQETAIEMGLDDA